MNNLSLRLICTRLFAIFALVILPAAGPVSAAQDAPDTPAAQQYETWPPRPLPTAGSSRSTGDPSPAPASNLYACSYASGGPEYVTQAVFSANISQENQWDLYQTPMCATADPLPIAATTADEVFPRLSADASSVIYVSDRAGNDEIYKVNVNGSGLTRLTNNTAIDTYPTFSPDGTQVAFTSDRAGGNADIYIMSSSGGAPLRLTTSANADVQPDWSPDGKKIAWIRRSGADGYLYVKNADGTGGERRLATLRYGGRPSWSPDGRRLSFEYDSDSNGWLELGAINADGSRLGVINSAMFEWSELIMGSWYGGPGGVGLIFSKLAYERIGRQWYITDAALGYKRLDSVYEDEDIFTGNVDFAFYPYARTYDVTPPEVYIETLPRYSPSPVNVVVRIKDATQGIVSLDSKSSQSSQWYTRNGSYQPDANGEASYTFKLSINEGQSYDFRVYGIDKGNNSGDPETAPITTSYVYKWSALAQVQDARETPLDGALINAGEYAFHQPVETHDGSASLYYFNATAQDLGAAVIKPGFGALPNPSWPVGTESEFLSILPPADNLIDNGYFEDPAGVLNDWQAAGELPVAAAAGRYGGSASRLGLECYTDLCFKTIDKLSQDIQGSFWLTFDAEGGLHHLAGNKYYYRSPAGQWEERAPLSGLPYSNYSGPLGMLPGNRPFTLIHALDEVVAVYTDAGNWDYTTITSTGWANEAVSDTLGQIHALYSNYNTLYYTKRLANGLWMAPVDLTWVNSGPVAHLAVGPDGTVHIVYINAGSGQGTINYLRILPDGTISPPETITGYYVPVSGGFSIELLVDSSGTLHLFADAKDYFHFWTRSLGGSWSAVQSDAVPVRGDNLVYKQGVVDSTGKLRFYYRLRNPQGIWEVHEVVKIPGESGYQLNRFLHSQSSRGYAYAAARDASGLMHIAWVGSTSSPIYYQQQQLLDEPAEAILAQSPINLPAGSYEPTLSFFYRLEEFASNDQIDFRLRLTPQDGAPVTLQEVSGSGETSAWRHAWFDLSPWKGQAVEVAFALEQFPGENGANLYLDEVTLGAWTTPTITGFTPLQIDWPAGEDSWIEITGENFMEGSQVYFGDQPAAEVVWIDSTHVRCRPSAEMPVGFYRLRLENPGGVTSDSFYRLLVGKALYLPAIMR